MDMLKVEAASPKDLKEMKEPVKMYDVILPQSLGDTFDGLESKGKSPNIRSTSPPVDGVVPAAVMPPPTVTAYSLLAAAAKNELDNAKWAIENENVAADCAAECANVATAAGCPVARPRRSALMIAAYAGAVEVMAYLLANGASANYLSPDDLRTPLHCACAGTGPRRSQAIGLLQRAGADYKRADIDGVSPLDLMMRAVDNSSTNGVGGNSFKSHNHASSQQEKLMKLLELVQDRKHSRSSVQGGDDKPHAHVSTNNMHSHSHMSLPSPGAYSGTATDNDNDIYSSDEFRMYDFKVRRCTRPRSHDWTECPFAHPGEKARRRDPRKYNYSGVACPDFRKGACRRGDACEFAHGVFECWMHPSRYRTQPCKDGRGCRRRVCFFAHCTEQLRPLPPGMLPFDLSDDGAGSPSMLSPPVSPTFSSYVSDNNNNMTTTPTPAVTPHTPSSRRPPMSPSSGSLQSQRSLPSSFSSPTHHIHSVHSNNNLGVNSEKWTKKRPAPLSLDDMPALPFAPLTPGGSIDQAQLAQLRGLAAPPNPSPSPGLHAVHSHP
eukprot:jgi/Chlat1/3176/Chrsp22S00249